MSKYNAETHDIRELCVGSREQTWVIRYIYAVLMNKICDEFGMKTYENPSPWKACQYDRSANLCQSHLFDLGLCNVANEPLMEKLLETAKLYAKEPEFDLSCIKKEYSYHEDPITHPSDAYANITGLGKRQFLYVYLNRDLYDIHVYSKTVKHEPHYFSYGTRRRNRYSQPYERDVTKIAIFPKARVQEVISTLCRVKMKEFLDDRLQLSSRIFYDLELQNLSNDRTDWSDVTRFRKDTPITAEEMETRMKQAADAVSFYQKALAELTSLRDRIAAGNSVDINKEQYEKAIEHFRENAPIYINEEDDIPVKQLAMLVLKGANEEQIAKEWMNPKYDKEV
jgi:hypothetical protein